MPPADNTTTAPTTTIDPATAAAGAQPPGGQTTPPAGGGGAGDAPQLPPWLGTDHGLTPEEIKSLSKRNWKSPGALVKSFFSLENKFGKRADEVGAKPKPGDVEAEREFNKFIGVPDSPDGYELKVPEGENPAVSKKLAEIGHKHGIPKTSFERFMAEANAFAAENEQLEVQEAKAKADAEERALKKELGGRFKEFAGIADFAVRKLAISNENLAAMQMVLGYTETMKLLNKLGTGMTEDGAYGGTNTTDPSPRNMTSAEAQTALNEKLADEKWSERYFAGNEKEREEVRQLLRAGARIGVR